MTAPLATVDNVEMLERESELSSQSLHPLSQIASGERSELVEKRLD